MKQLVILILSSIMLQCQSSKKEPMQGTDFYISEHSITYKNQEVPFGKPVAEWVKIFGTYSRIYHTSVYIWDDLGIFVSESNYNSEINELHIFFMNLDSPLGQMGKLNEARGRMSLKFVKERNHKDGWFPEKTDLNIYAEMEERNTRGSDAPDKFIYPFKIYEKPLNIEGAVVKAGMRVSEINKERKKANLPVIKYYDADLNWKYEHGSTTTLSNGYFTTFKGFSTSEEQENAN
ncbi:DUF7738 domain-containing protein, partial [Flavobacterium branchiarum]